MDRYLISKDIEFDAGHRVPNHASKCRNPHGHRYKLRVHVSGPLVAERGASDEGMVADFGEIKEIMTERVHDLYDHGFIVSNSDDVMFKALADGSTADKDQNGAKDAWQLILVPGPPTAENLACWIYNDLKGPIASLHGGLHLEYVELYETPTSVARFPCP